MRRERLFLFLCTLATAVFSAIVALLICMGLCMLFGSCSSVKYVPVESVKTDSIYLTNWQRDSIYMRDSVYIKEKGDTVYQYRYKYLFVDKAVHDTLYVERVDSIQVPYPVEKPLSRWQRLRQTAGTVALVVLLLGVLGGAGWFFFHRKK